MSRIEVHGRTEVAGAGQSEAGVPIKELCRKYGVSEATFYSWRKK